MQLIFSSEERSSLAYDAEPDSHGTARMIKMTPIPSHKWQACFKYFSNPEDPITFIHELSLID